MTYFELLKKMHQYPTPLGRCCVMSVFMQQDNEKQAHEWEPFIHNHAVY
jgi:hypothetical protein